MFNRIAVGTDGTDTAGRAVDVAIDLAQRYGAQLLIFSVYRPVSDARLADERAEAPEDIQWTVTATEYVDATLAEATERATAHGIEATAIAREGQPAHVVCELATEYDADLLVIGNQGMQRRILGSVPKTICQHAPCSVVLAKTS